MANIKVMRRNFDGTDWKRAFAEAVMRLRPDMNPDRADEISDAEYLQAKSVEPAAAALRWFDREQTDTPESLDRASNGD